MVSPFNSNPLKTTHWFISFIGLMLVLSIPSKLYSQRTVPDSVYLYSINKTLFWENKPAKYSYDKNEVAITVQANTNLFCTPDGGYRVNSAPRLLFLADSEFVFRAKVTCGLENNWDGAVLIAEVDSNYWVKLCFEKDYKGNKRIVTVENNLVSDDCNSDIIEENSIYLQIAKKSDVLFLYYSQNNTDWYLVRNFRFPFNNPKLGFLVQSPAGDGNEAVFSEIFYSAIPIQDFWKGK